MPRSSFARKRDIPNPNALSGVITLDGVLPNDAYIVGVPKVIFKDQSTTKLTNGGNVGAGLDPIHTFSLPALALKADGDILDVWYSGDYAQNDNDKRIVGVFGGTSYEDSGLCDLDTATGWLLRSRVMRVTNTSVIVASLFMANIVIISTNAGVDALVNAGAGFVGITRNTAITGLPSLDANATTLLVQAEGTANDDIVINQAIMTLTRFS